MTLHRGWISAGLGPYRPAAGTYDEIRSSSLPALPADDSAGLMAWMKYLATLGEAAMGKYGLQRVS
jgi:hypothetical protein